MVLVVEDGTGLINSDSYDSVVNADSYAAAFGRDEWAALPAAKKEVRMRLATQALDTLYTARGRRFSATQSLEFPRVRCVFWATVSQGLNSGVPAQVRRACCELATLPGLPDLLPSGIRSDVKMEMKKLDGLQKQTEYFDRVVDRPRAFHVADKLMDPYTDGGTSSGMKSGRLQPC